MHMSMHVNRISPNQAFLSSIYVYYRTQHLWIHTVYSKVYGENAQNNYCCFSVLPNFPRSCCREIVYLGPLREDGKYRRVGGGMGQVL
jgi:hypothetical protein